MARDLKISPLRPGRQSHQTRQTVPLRLDRQSPQTRQTVQAVPSDKTDRQTPQTRLDRQRNLIRQTGPKT